MKFSNKHITLKHLLIDGQKMIGLQFYQDRIIEALIKELPDLNWSEAFCMFYIFNTKDNLDLIFKTFKGIAWINCQYFYKNRVINPSKSTKNLTWYTKRQHQKTFRRCPDDYIQKLVIKKYANSTIKSYLHAFESFINHYQDKELLHITEQEVHNYLEYLVKEKKSNSYLNIAINSIKFYYEVVMGMPNRFYAIERPRKEQKLPHVLSREEILLMIENTNKKFLETNYPQGRATGVFRWFHFDLTIKKTEIFYLPLTPTLSPKGRGRNWKPRGRTSENYLD